MPLVPNFIAAGTSDPTAIQIVDTSTGSDGAITDRVITLYKTDQSILGVFDFPLSAGSSITINPLTVDMALNISISWNNNVATPLYTLAEIFAFVQFAEIFFYSLTQEQTAQPDIINDQQYYANKSTLRTLIDSALQAITVGKDIYSAASCIALYQPYLQNPKLYF